MTMPGLPRWSSALSRRMIPGLVIVILAGLMWMHALGAGHHASAAPAGHATPIQVADPCLDGEEHGPCPFHPRKHPGPICQSGAVPGASVAMPAAGLPAAHTHAEPASAAPLSPRTAAPDAGGGSGCGPPSLTMLSISRT